MSFNDYIKIECTQEGLYNKFSSLVDSQLDWYESEALRMFNKKKFDSIKDDQIIQQILPKSPNDRKKKFVDPQYYLTNAKVFLDICRQILSSDFIAEFDAENTVDEIALYNYHHLFHNLICDSLILLNGYSENILEQKGQYGVWPSSIQHHATLYQSLGQSIFGQKSFHSKRELEPNLAISIIRQIIELRIRRAFGVIAWYSPNTQSVEPLPLSLLFNEIKKHKDDIVLSMQFDCLTRIYGWANIFLHAGIKECTWQPIFVKNYMAEFCLSTPARDGSWNINHGIQIPKTVLESITESLEKDHPKGFQLIKWNPEAAIT